MKVLFPTLLTLPSNKVHGIQVTHMCEGFAEADCDVTLLVPHDSEVEKVHAHYGLVTPFAIEKIWTIGSPRWGGAGYRLRAFSFALGCWWYARRQQADLLFTREALPAILCRRHVRKTVWEIHNEDFNALVRRALRLVDVTIAISPALKELSVRLGAKPESVEVIVNGVTKRRFSAVSELTQAACRERVGLPAGKKLILFTGNAVVWKGVETLAAATQYMPSNAEVVFVGRVAGDMRARLQSLGNPERLRFIQEQPYTEIPYFQRAADILILPTSGKTERARFYTSPIKVFEYLLSGVPIVATDIESTRAVLTDDVATFAAPDDAVALAAACQQIFDQPVMAEQKSSAAKKLGATFTWPERARRIMETVQD